MEPCGKKSSAGIRPTRRGGATLACTLVAAVVVTSSSGCGSGPSRIHAIGVDPEQLSERVVAEFDADGNGALTTAELAALPPVRDSFSKYDADSSGEVTAAELRERFAAIFDPDVGVCPVRCQVTRNGRPLEGAEVRFIPPAILSDMLPAASGVTTSSGITGLRLAPEDMPKNIPSQRVAVMRPGMYLVHVTHPSLQIPPQYNTQTTIGKEVFSETLNGPPLPIRLKF